MRGVHGCAWCNDDTFITSIVRMTSRFCVTLEGTVAQLSAELELERSRSASLHAEKAALRGHLAGIVSRLRPNALPGSPAAPAAATAAVPEAVAAAAAALLAAGPSGELPELGQPLGEGADGRLSLDAWGKSAAARRNAGGAAEVTVPRDAAVAEAARQEFSDCGEGLAVPITPGRTSEPPVKGKGEAVEDPKTGSANNEESQQSHLEDEAHVSKRGRADSAKDWTFTSAADR